MFHKKLLPLIALLLVCCPAIGQSKDRDAQKQQTELEATDANRAQKLPAVARVISESASPSALKVLFVGNSLIYAGNIPEIFVGLVRARDAQAAVKVSEVVGSNYTLKNHREYGLAEKVIDEQGPWDFVVLQEQSSHLGNELAKAIEDVRPLAVRVTSMRGRPIIFDAWTKVVAPDYAQLNQCNAQLARSLGLDRIPILTALAQAKSVQGAKLFIEDGHHLSSDGNYLAACMVYAKLLRRSPVGLPNKVYLYDRVISDIDFNRAKQLQAIAATYVR